MSEPGGGGTQWLRKVSVEVPVVDKKTGNATIEKVGVVEAWSWPSKEDAAEAKEAAAAKDDEAAAEALTPEKIDDILGAFVAAIRGKIPIVGVRADRQSGDWAGYTVMPAIGLKVTDKDDKDQMKRWLKLLVESGDLVERTEQDARRHPKLFLDISEKTRKRFDESSEK